MDPRSDEEDCPQRMVRLFLAAGSCALFLSIVHVHPEFWFISLFALVPYIWRLNRAGLIDSVALGLILATCFSLVIYAEELKARPEAFLFKLFILSSVISLFGMAVNRLRRQIGFYPVFTAALWLPLEYCLIRYTGKGIILDVRAADSGWLTRMGSLFGLLTITFFVVLINSLAILVIEYAGRKLFSKSKLRGTCREANFPLFENVKSTKRWNYLPNLRGPPVEPAWMCIKSGL